MITVYFEFQDNRKIARARGPGHIELNSDRPRPTQTPVVHIPFNIKDLIMKHITPAKVHSPLNTVQDCIQYTHVDVRVTYAVNFI